MLLLVLPLPLQSEVQQGDLLDPPIRAACEFIFAYPREAPVKKSTLDRILARWLEGRKTLAAIESSIRVVLDRNPEIQPYVELYYFEHAGGGLPSLHLKVKNARFNSEPTQVAVFVFKSNDEEGVRGHISLLFFPSDADGPSR